MKQEGRFGRSSVLAIGFVIAATAAPATATIEPKADALLRSMSDALAGAKEFRFTTEEHHERLRRNGERVVLDFSREGRVERPNKLRFDITSGERSGAFYYDGTKLTFVGNAKKVWAQTGVPPTIDEAMDYVAVRLGIPLTMADILYSSPYEALGGEGVTGKYVGAETIAGHACHHLAFQHEVLDYDVWVREGEQALPCQLEMRYKLDAGNPVSRITFKDFDLDEDFPDATFAFTPPDGYRRIRVVGRRDPAQAEPTSATDEPAPGTAGE
jgi:hypothetical protein